MQKKRKKTKNPVYSPAYPNAADVNYYSQKLIDIATGIVSGIGLVVSLLFLVNIM